jgi:hypothetical protein
MLFSTLDFCVVRKYYLNHENDFIEKNTSGNIIACNSLEIRILDRDKLAIGSHNEIIIYDFEKNTIDFRIKFAKNENFETTTRKGMMCIGRHKKSLILNFKEKNIHKQLKRSNKNFTDTELVTNLYALHEKFRKIYPFIFNKNND